MASAERLPRSTPEAEGIPSQAVLNFVAALEEHSHPLDAVQGFMLLRHGKVAAEGWWEPYGPDFPHTLFSLSKSFTATAIGLAVAEGRLTVNDPVLKFFRDDAPPQPSANLQAMQVRHLLAMNTGHHADTTNAVFGCGHDHWPRAFLSLPVEHAPGTWFAYNTAATYMLSAIITQLTGETLLDYLRPRLFAPLGIDNPTWDADPRGISLGGTGLHIKLEEIARFGQMYLQNGIWAGRQVVPAAWVAEATFPHSDNSNTQSNPDWSVGYGYQFWRCRHDAYRGDGAFGQFCVVLPAQDAVLAINSGVRDMQAVLDKVWEHLLPVMEPQALAPDPAAYGALREKLGSLSLPAAAGNLPSPQAQAAVRRRYTLQDNELNLQRIALELEEHGSTLVIVDGRGEHRVPVGSGSWRRGRSDLRGLGEEPVAACGAWPAQDTYEVRVCLYESELCFALRLHLTGEELTLAYEPNVAWVEPKVTTIAGHAAVHVA